MELAQRRPLLGGQALLERILVGLPATDQGQHSTVGVALH
jgi:hypothetical protein